MNEEKIKQIAHKIDKLVVKKDIKCPLCNNKHWKMHPEISGQLPIDLNAKVFVAGEGNALPSVQMYCQECGYIASLNLSVLEKIE